MKGKREEMKARLLARAEVLFDELLDWDEKAQAPNLTEIEDIVLKLRKELGKRMVQELIEGQEGRRPVPGPRCPTCEKEMSFKGMKEKRVESRAGPLEVERGYYYCAHCDGGIFPPGSST